jgi:hypothetical protein
MDLKRVSEELAFIRSEMKRLDEAFMEAAHSRYYEKASEFRVEKHKNKLRLHELKYNCLVYLEECEFKWYRWKQLQEARLFIQREFGF